MAIKIGGTTVIDDSRNITDNIGTIPASKISGSIPIGNLSTATTQAESDSSTKIATTAYVTNKITTLIGGAPSTLNDLNELAAAINDDANYNATLTTALATKLPLAGGTMTGNIAHAGNFTLDVAGDIILDADGGDLKFHDGGTHIGSIFNDTNNLAIYSKVNNADMKFIGVDGGSDVTALTFDMSDAGTAIFNNGVTAHKFVQTGTTGSYIYAASFSRSSTGIVTPDIWGTDDTFVIGTSSSTESVGFSGANAFFYGNVGIGTTSPQKKLEVTGDLQLDANNASIWLKSGAAGTDGRINWTYDTDSTVYASAGLDYDTRASTGFHLDVGYPITIDSSSSTGIKFITATAQRAVINNSGLSVTGNIAVSGTVDGVDIATRDGILTSTTTTANAALPKAGGVVTGNIDISGTNAIRHNGDTNTYMQFHDTDQWRVVTAGVERLEVNNNSMVVANTLSMNGHNIDMNNNDIVGVDQIVHEGDSNTYIRFHAEDQFQVVTGGTERLEVNNSGANVTGNITVSGTVDGRNVSTDGTKLDGIATGATANVGDITAVTAGTGLSGGGTSGSVTVNLSATTSPIVATELSNSIDLDTLNASQAGFYYQSANADTSGNNYPNGHAGSLIVQKSAGNATQLYQTYNSSSPELFFRSNYTTGYSAWRQVWHNYNDGSGSGLDADLLDGQHGSYYQKKTTVQDAAPSGATGDLWYESDSGSFYVYYGGAWVDVAPGVETNTNLQINSLGVGTAASGTSGEIRATNDVTAYYSDERLKDFHGNIDSALDKVNQLNGYYFTENETAKELGYDNDKRQVGVSAQEVEAVLPEVVAEAPISDEYLTVKYEKLAPLFIEAIKEIDKKYQDKIDMLMEEIEKLKGN
jgi:hypothetical protein